MKVEQLKDYVDTTLAKFTAVPYNEDAGWLILGTMATESDLRFIEQWPTGPACGFIQMEPDTARDIQKNYLRFRMRRFRSSFIKTTGMTIRRTFGPDLPYYLKGNLPLQIVMARLHYYRVPHPLPHTLPEMAEYWKRYYNTDGGKGKPSHFDLAFRQQFSTAGSHVINR